MLQYIRVVTVLYKIPQDLSTNNCASLAVTVSQTSKPSTLLSPSTERKLSRICRALPSARWLLLADFDKFFCSQLFSVVVGGRKHSAFGRSSAKSSSLTHRYAAGNNPSCAQRFITSGESLCWESFVQCRASLKDKPIRLLSAHCTVFLI